MNKAIVSRTFSAQKYKDADLVVKASTISEQMTNNVYFPDIQLQLDELNAKTESYRRALSDAEMGGKLLTALKRNSRKELEMCLQELATYVQLKGKGDIVALSSTGFELHRKASKIGMLDRPEDVRLIQGIANGSIEISCNVVDKALYYVFAYCEAPETSDSVWIQITSTRRKITIDGLRSRKEYCFKVAAARTHPSRVWSDVVSSYVV